MNSKKKKELYFLPAYVYGVVVFIASSIPTKEIVETREQNNFFGIFLSDASFHFFGFGVLTGLLCFAFYKTQKSSLPYVRIGLFALGFGLFIEIYQMILPYRSFKLDDLFWDFVGIVFILLLFLIILAVKKKA